MAEYPELLFFDTFSHGSAQVSSPVSSRIHKFDDYVALVETG